MQEKKSVQSKKLNKENMVSCASSKELALKPQYNHKHITKVGDMLLIKYNKVTFTLLM